MCDRGNRDTENSKVKRVIVAVLESISCIGLIVAVIMCVMDMVRFTVPFFVLIVFMILISIDVCMETEGH